MNSVSVGGRRITLQRVAVNRTVPNVGASKPAEFAPNASQVLLDRCSGNGDNIWHVATGGGHAGPIVLLNCTFRGTGHIEGHQRWTTGMLLDNCQAPRGRHRLQESRLDGLGPWLGTGLVGGLELRGQDLRHPTAAGGDELDDRLHRPEQANAAAV